MKDPIHPTLFLYENQFQTRIIRIRPDSGINLTTLVIWTYLT